MLYIRAFYLLFMVFYDSFNNDVYNK